MLTRQVRKQVLKFRTTEVEVDLPGWYPEGDGDSLHDPEDCEVVDAACLVAREGSE